jgi:hypothetical protein
VMSRHRDGFPVVAEPGRPHMTRQGRALFGSNANRNA